MAKKKSAPSAPVVTNLPLPISDTPLVIDLPDGQKLVIGKMSQGSVIEVATWRGTGRPDSRTSRLMLGMSGAATAAQTEADQSVSVPAPAKVFSNNKFDVRALISRINIAPVIDALKTLKSKAPKRVESLKKNEPEEFTTSVDIDEWLAKITSKAEAKRARTTKSPTKAPAKKTSKTRK
ncbi:unannotated protein [freshwater metagenome]|uniref:Unannotated protein n=1 Tax=freshwater metagenome TaxID=449393 RepID=A0A6J7GYZ7_9ZZZZ|nr:hypothetical protein [Actinomycetota bacterium]